MVTVVMQLFRRNRPTGACLPEMVRKYSIAKKSYKSCFDIICKPVHTKDVRTGVYGSNQTYMVDGWT